MASSTPDFTAPKSERLTLRVRHIHFRGYPIRIFRKRVEVQIDNAWVEFRYLDDAKEYIEDTL